MKTKASKKRSYELAWRYESRVATQHLGSRKYSTSSRAIGELVANALDAHATLIDIELVENALGGTEKVVITDNGKGMSPAELRGRFVVVGVEPTGEGEGTRLGRLGVGRLAVHRIGNVSTWTTTAGQVRSAFTLRTDDGKRLKVNEESVSAESPGGTTIEIFNVLDTGKDRLTPIRVANDLLSQYCSFLLGHPKRRIRVNGGELAVEELIESREREIIPASEKVPTEATLDHLMLKRPVDQSRFPKQVLFSAKGRTVTSIQPEEPLPAQYLGIVECPYLDSIVTSNRESVIDMDEGYRVLKEAALERINEYSKKISAQRKTTFIEQARQEDFYPYREKNKDPIAEVEQAVYDVALEKMALSENLTERPLLRNFLHPLNREELDVGHRHPLGLQQQIPQVLVAPPAVN